MIRRDLAGLMTRFIAGRICQHCNEQVGNVGRVDLAKRNQLLAIEMSEF
jgi:Zn ribbon nucleic-acid-binding protein